MENSNRAEIAKPSQRVRDIEDWMKMYRPIDNCSGHESGITIEDRSMLVFDHNNEDDLAALKMADPDTVWTILEGDTGEQYVVNGFHIVNREGYMITEVKNAEGDVQLPIWNDSVIERVEVPLYSHMYTIAFEVNDSTSECGDDVTAARLRRALVKRIFNLPDDVLVSQAIGGLDDTYSVNP